MIKPILVNTEVQLPGGLGHDWLTAYTSDFRRRMMSLLGYEFRNLPCGLAFNFMSSHRAISEDSDKVAAVSPQLLEPYVNLFDLKRLESYSKNLVDFHLVMDLVPAIARLYFHVLP